jgi:hypothetical protein
MHNYEALNNTLAPMNVSSKYEFMPTIELVNRAREHGYKVSAYSQKNVRSLEKRPFTRHLVRLRMANVTPVVGDVVPEILILNSHDKTTRLKFMLGFFRFICANGLVTGDIFEDFTYTHTIKNPFDKILDQFSVIEKVAAARLETINAMKETHLDNTQTWRFVSSTVNILDNPPLQNKWQLDEAQRNEVKDYTLWNLFNRVQENAVKGNVTLLSRNNRTRKARPVQSIDRNLDINQRLWKLAESFLPTANDSVPYLQAA